MVTFEKTIEIEAPVDYVFEWAIQPENWVRCMPSLFEVEKIEVTDEGTRYRTTRKVLGRRTTSEELVVVDRENDEIVSIFQNGDIDGQLRWSYSEADGVTTDGVSTVSIFADVSVGTSLFDRAIRPVVSRSLTRQYRNALETMKELVEAERELDAAPDAMEAVQ